MVHSGSRGSARPTIWALLLLHTVNVDCERVEKEATVVRSSRDKERRCWECERKAEMLISVTLYPRPDTDVHFLLCQSCYVDVYLLSVGALGIDCLAPSSSSVLSWTEAR